MKQQLTKTEAHVLECLCALIPSLIQSNDLLDLRKVSYLFADQLLIAAAKSKKGPASWTTTTLCLGKNYFSYSKCKVSRKGENHVR